MSSLDLDPIESWARAELDRKNAAREQALRWSRELVRACANSIRAIHRREFAAAEQLLGEAHSLNGQMCTLLASIGDVYWAGYVQDAQKELVEASCTLALVNGSALPEPQTFGVAPAPFLNGLAEAVGELRRYLLVAMDDIYSLLVTLDYPDALTGGLRRTTDNTRGILEKTRGDLTLALRQEALVEALRSAEGVRQAQDERV
jgi:translin